MKLIRSCIVGTCCCFAAAVLPLEALAQADLKAELGRCAAIAGINERVACYDKLAHPEQTRVAEPVQAPAAKTADTGKAMAAPAANAPVGVETQAAKIENFGKTAAIESDAKGEDALVDTVVALKEIELNKLQITLQSGQVWRQASGKPFFIHLNDVVRITKSGWGASYRLSKEGSPTFIQVQRQQ